MDASGIVEMIDTIREGKPHTIDVKGSNSSICGGDNLRFVMAPDVVTVMSADLITTCDISSPRQAREIAAALVAWAERQEDDRGATGAKFLFEIGRARAKQFNPEA